MIKPLQLALVCLLAASLACSFGGTPGNGKTSDPNILLQDDFSNAFTGWDSYRGDEGITDYEDGGYRILVNQPNHNYWATPGRGDRLPNDVRIEVEATKTAGPEDNLFGVICRYTSQDNLSNFYYFAITSAGYAGIFKVSDSDEVLLTGGGKQMAQTSVINSGATLNRIRAECIGQTLTLYVNGTQVDSVTDAAFVSGDVGLMAGSYEQRGVDISFDNLKVTKP